MKKQVKCSNCGHKWETSSKMILVTCSSCGKKTEVIKENKK